MLQAIALAAGLAWASGLRLYLVLFMAGLLAHLGYLDLPESLALLQHPLVMAASGTMVLAEFVADKIPGFDSFWDTLQTFVRIPAGGMLAAFSLGAADPALMLAAGIIGGTITAGTALTKAGSRLAINTSPEPFSNWAASLSEEALVLGGFWLMLMHPWVFLGFLLLFLGLIIWLLPKLWRFLHAMLRRILSAFGAGSQT
ncbi:MAG: DUF4126 domain-containing protein [Zoogloeaceae bacterium]|nr:DUF4126 domain-containing protein [Zoogloeaceae bacterium]